jgi:HSP90 family molecular chaperone
LEQKIKSYYEPLTNWTKDILKEEVDNVILKSYNEEDAMVVVASDKGMSAHM